MLELKDKIIICAISFLRTLTQHQGYASISLFDAGSGDDIEDGGLTIYLERDGLTMENRKVYSVLELYRLLVAATSPFPGMDFISGFRRNYISTKKSVIAGLSSE